MTFFSLFSPYATNPVWIKTEVTHGDCFPVPPVFFAINQKMNNGQERKVFVDALTYENNNNNKTEYDAYSIFMELNEGKKIKKNIQKIKDSCDQKNNSQACLGYGRIKEFGSYCQDQDLEIAKKYYEKANNVVSDSLLSFFYRTYSPEDYLKSILLLEDGLNNSYLNSLPIKEENTTKNNENEKNKTTEYILTKEMIKEMSLENIKMDTLKQLLEKKQAIITVDDFQKLFPQLNNNNKEKEEEENQKTINLNNETNNNMNETQNQNENNTDMFSFLHGDDIVENGLAKAVMYRYGAILPQSYLKSFELAKKFAKIASEMDIVIFNNSFPFSEFDTKPSNEADRRYINNLRKIATPYFSQEGRKKIQKSLINSIRGGNYSSLNILAYLLHYELENTQNQEENDIQRTKSLYNEAIQLGLHYKQKPIYFLYYMDHKDEMYKMRDDQINELNNLLKEAVDDGYAPAMLEYALQHENENIEENDVERISSILKKAVDFCYYPAIYEYAIQLSQKTDRFAKSIRIMLLLMGTTPLSSILSQYVQNGSTHAYLKMLDMGMLPPSDIRNIKVKGLYDADKGIKYIENIHNAEIDDVDALISLALTANDFNTSILCCQQISEIGKPAAQMFSQLFHTYLCFKYFKQNLYEPCLTNEEKQYIYSHLRIFFYIGMEITVFIALSILITIRVRNTFP